jgi:uncharacterized membrane protein
VATFPCRRTVKATTQFNADVLGEEATMSLSGPWFGHWFAFLRVLFGHLSGDLLAEFGVGTAGE